MLRRFFSITLLFAIFAQVHAQDSIRLKYELGLSCMKERRYVEAYEALKFYLDNASKEERHSVYYNKGAKIFHEVEDKIREECDDYYNQAINAKQLGQQARHDSLCKIYLQKCVLSDLKQKRGYTKILTYHALSFQQKGDTEKCLSLLKEVVDICYASTEIDSVKAGEALCHIASIEYQQGHYDKAIENGSEAARLYKNHPDKATNVLYGNTLVNLSNYFFSRDALGDREHAKELNETAMTILPKKHPAYVQAQNNLAQLNSLSDNPSAQLKKNKKADKAAKKLKEKNEIYLASSLNTQAIDQAKLNNYEQALAIEQQALDILESKGDTLNLNFANVLSNMASFENILEHYGNAISLWNRAIPIFEQIEGQGSRNYLSCKSEIAAVYSKMGELEKSTDIMKGITQMMMGDSTLVHKAEKDYASLFTLMASGYAEIGNYQQAMSLQSQALSIFRIRHDVADEANALNELSNYLFSAKQLVQAIDTCQKAIQLYEKINGHYEEHAIALNNLSKYYYSTEDFDKALSASREAERYYRKKGGLNTSLYAKILTNQALYEAKHDNLEKAISLSLSADSIHRQVLGNSNPDNVLLWFNLANYYIKTGKTDEAQQRFHEALKLQMQHVRNNFSHLSPHKRELYWDTKSFIFHSAPYMACLIEKNDSALIDAYDAQLFSKGVLLNSEIDFNNFLSKMDDQKLKEKYSELSIIKNKIDLLEHDPTKEAQKQISKLRDKAEDLTSELMKGCKEFGDFTQSMSIRYPQIIEALKKNEAAIEFFDIETQKGDRIYWALLARHGQKAPKLFRLFSKNELNDFHFAGMPLTDALTTQEGINAVFEDTLIGHKVWTDKLMKELEGVKNIWFAPTGLFYQWGIEYLRYGDKRINDLFGLHRISSTKFFAQQKGSGMNDNITEAAIFGGLYYDASADDLQAANAKLSEGKRDYISEYEAMLLNDSTDVAMAEEQMLAGLTRDGLSVDDIVYLPGTLTEAKRILECLLMHDIEAKLYKEDEGTEEAFKNLSGRGISLLHVATHGFSFSPEDVDQDAYSYLNIYSDNAIQADNSLSYSGLLLSGAKNVLTGKPLPDSLENGVLTAKEIAKLDLRGLNLAVLSACQTGLGELKEDGVFGLQRGFKKAGAQTLVMSLWSVGDDTTQLMMTSFYEALLSALSRHDAFLKAQVAVRNAYPEPFDWASFIMLDDI